MTEQALRAAMIEVLSRAKAADRYDDHEIRPLLSVIAEILDKALSKAKGA